DQRRPQHAVGFGQNLLQHLGDVLLFIRYRDQSDHGALPGIHEIQLRHRDVKVRAQAILQTAQHLALVLQGLRIGDVQFQRQQSNRHTRLRTCFPQTLFCFWKGGFPSACSSLSGDSWRGMCPRNSSFPVCPPYLRPEDPLPWTAASAAVSFWTLKHSRISPTFTSLKLAIPKPHSKPARTSLASSLKRFREFN